MQHYRWIEDGSLWDMPALADWQDKQNLDIRRYNAVDDATVSFFDSDFSDECIGAVLENSTVSEVCFTLFLGKRRSEYFITHATLFLMFSKKVLD